MRASKILKKDSYRIIVVQAHLILIPLSFHCQQLLLHFRQLALGLPGELIPEQLILCLPLRLHLLPLCLLKLLLLPHGVHLLPERHAG